ncbi:FAD-binding protein [Streptacidiphilus sp. PB12-B1b]|uniref:FAD-dependent oxidoreductase n=1 Tax=Streptacidiphilus sp. PB12-B1b TaxID=2705012 RepID=UPI0015FB37D3|nr:FAD-dependent oxidoreductase [Streptacidiphilus sp. PB12-B1b]QMU78322.1 FAD-binding protein [Streptacidiphilus sp. PB12-B1b]
MPVERHDVVIVGAGLAGLSAAAFLAHRGLRPLVLDRHPSTSVQPKARVQNVRTMEVLRILGLDEGVRRATVPGARRHGGVAETVLGGVLAEPKRRMPDWSRYSAASWGLLSQERLECMMSAYALSRGVDVRFNTGFVGFEEDGTGLLVHLSDSQSGYPSAVHAEWLVAADGHQSAVRSAVDVPGTGRGKIAENVRVVFSADLRELIGTDEILFFLRHPTRGVGTVHSTDLPNRYVVSMEVPSGVEARDTWSHDEVVGLVRDVVGLDSLDPAICEVTCWDMVDDTAVDFRAGRVVMIGDAAHLIPPIGGFGGNTALQDGAELAWRLADVVTGVAGPGAIDDFSRERRAFARFISDQAHALYVRRLAPGLRDESVAAEVAYQNCVFGFRYPAGTFVDEAGDESAVAEAVESVEPGSLDGRPGMRAPHMVFRGPAGPVATHDLIDYQYTLLAAESGGPWRDAMGDVTRDLGLGEANALQIGVDLQDPDGAFATTFGVGDQGAVLIRPDGYIAYRAVGTDADPHARLNDVFMQLLHRAELHVKESEPMAASAGGRA